MTLFAWGYGVQADQRECRQIVIKKYSLTPRLLVVAAAALLSYLLLVDVVFRVAAVAIGFQLRSALIRRMTAVALRFDVSPT